MNEEMSIHVKNAWTVKQFAINAIEKLVKTTIPQKALIDILGGFKDTVKELEKFVKEFKEQINFNGDKAVFGTNYKVEKTIVQKYDIPVSKIVNELSFEDFQKVVKVDSTKLKVFLPESRIKEIREPLNPIESYKFTAIKK